MFNPYPSTGPAPDRIAHARALAALAPQLPGDDSTARDALAGIAILLGGKWTHPEAAVIGAIRLVATSPSNYLRQLAAGVVCSLHVRPVGAPLAVRASDAAGVAVLVSFVLGGDGPARDALYEVADLLMQATPDLDRALMLALDASAAEGVIATLAKAVAMTLCAPANEEVLAEIGWGPFESAGGALQ